MIRLALDHGYTSYLVIKVSQELDSLLIQTSKRPYKGKILIFKDHQRLSSLYIIYQSFNHLQFIKC